MEPIHIICCVASLALLIAILVISLDTQKKVRKLQPMAGMTASNNLKAIMGCLTPECSNYMDMHHMDYPTSKQCLSGSQGDYTPCCNSLVQPDGACYKMTGQKLASCIDSCVGGGS